MKKKGGRPKKAENERLNPSDRIKCELCNKEIARSGKNQHKKTKIHEERERTQTTIKEILGNYLIPDKKTFKDRLKTGFTNMSGETIFLNKKQHEFITKINN